MKTKFLWAAASSLLAANLLTGCEGGKSRSSDGGGKPDALNLEVVNQSACYDPANGTTRLILQYIARDGNGRPLQEASGNITTQLLIDGSPVDVEAVLTEDSQLLDSNLAMSLVLDASYSMTQHEPPAFEPMKDAAISILADTAQTWQSANSEFYWELAWFDSYLYRPADNNAGEAWTIGDIAYIPEPVSSGTYTALYKAVDYMINVHAELYAAGIAAGERDQQVMVVLSDGKDNHSFFDNSTHLEQGSDNQMVFWQQMGLPPVATVGDITDPELLVPNLRILVLGLGDDIERGELEAIAALGNGQTYYGASSETLDELFAQVQRELATQNTLGIETPLADGEYNFTLQTERSDDGKIGEHTWTMAAGTSLPECSQP